MKLSDKIWVCRKKAGLSQEALAECIGVSRQAISKWETGEAAPEISKLPLLTRTFGVTADWLLDDSAEPEEDVPVDEAFAEETSAEESTPDPEPRRMYSDMPVSAWPSWVEHLPGWIGKMVKRFGWLFGLRIAIGGALFTAMGFVAKAMFASMDKMANDGFNRVLSSFHATQNAGMTFYDNTGNVIDPGSLDIDVGQFGLGSASPFGFGQFNVVSSAADPFGIFCNFIIILGLVMLIGGALLAWHLKKWGQKQA